MPERTHRTLTVIVTADGVTNTITPALGAPTCHGPMRRDGSQWVCDSCGGWIDPGAAGAHRDQLAYTRMSARR
ncbi:zf-TFIIB domain-containing protein [Streptomyces griseoviridis]|uniref:TFIIB-type zinc ribbon-containing protein n=1 Tax=Streptomyces griseoviridis TaxID=45398 RepID=UPI00344BFF16